MSVMKAVVEAMPTAETAPHSVVATHMTEAATPAETSMKAATYVPE